MDDLSAYEARLAQEKEENARLESRLQALKASADASIDRFANKSTAAASAPAAQSQQPSLPDANVLIQQLAAITASFGTAEQSSNSVQRQRSDDSSSVISARGRAVGASNKSVVSVGARSAGGRSVRSTSSSVRHGTGGKQTVVPNTATPSVVYRSSIYRSVSPSKRAHNGVVVSNFGRSARFQEDKVEVPGPGQYDPHATDFRPVAVPVAPKIDDGNLGHTWSMYKATVGTGVTPSQDHYNRMAAATARIPMQSQTPSAASRLRSPEPGERSLDALSPGTVGSSVSQARQAYGMLGTGTALGLGAGGGASTVGGGGEKWVSTAINGLLNAHHGDPKAALTAAVRKEAALRKELEIMHNNANTIRLNAGQLASVNANQIESLQIKLGKKDKTIEKLHSKLQAWNDVFLRADQTMAELSQWVTDAQNASQGRNPALGRAADTVRQLQTVIDSAHALVSAGPAQNADAASDSGYGATPGGQQQAAQGGSSNTGAGAQGYMAYSSLSAALSTPQAGSVGDMGNSSDLVNSQVFKQRAVAAGPPPVAARDRGLTGAQAAGLGLNATAGRGVSAADIQSGAATPIPGAIQHGLSADDIKAFVKSATDARLAQAQGQGGPSHSNVSSATAALHAGREKTQVSGGASPQKQAQQQQQAYQQQQQPQNGREGDDAYEGFAQAALAQASSRMPQAPPPAVTQPAGSVQSRLQALFAYYSGCELSTVTRGSTIRAADYMRLLADSGATGNGGQYEYEAEASFHRAVAHTGAPGDALPYDAWVVALTDFACRRAGQSGPESDPEGLLVSPEAFRRALDAFLMPLAARLKQTDPAFGYQYNAGAASSASSSSSAAVGGAAARSRPVESDAGLKAMLAGFAETFLKPEVLSFFNEHRGALQGMFNYYAGQGGVGAPANALNRRALQAWAADMKISPEMLPKNELLQLAREVSGVGGGRSNSPDRDLALSYPEWCELLGLVAHVIVGPAHAQSVLGITQPSMLQKLQLLMVDVSHRSPAWPMPVAGDAQRMVRAIEGSLRGQLAGARGGVPAEQDATRAATRAAMQRFMA